MHNETWKKRTLINLNLRDLFQDNTVGQRQESADHINICIPAQFRYLHIFGVCIRTLIESIDDIGNGSELISETELAVQEIATNIVEHGYQESHGIIKMSVQIIAGTQIPVLPHAHTQTNGGAQASLNPFSRLSAAQLLTNGMMTGGMMRGWVQNGQQKNGQQKNGQRKYGRPSSGQANAIRQLVVELEDDAPYFDPFSVKRPDLDKVHVRGYGLFLVEEMTDHFSHYGKRATEANNKDDDMGNIWQLVK
ncbi:MAG: hypothetical protein AAF639_42880, partial [Chloroflexota bacterium]